MSSGSSTSKCRFGICTQSFQDWERIPKIQGLLNECMAFLDDELSVITGPYEDLLSLDEVIERELILYVLLNVNKKTKPVTALGKMLSTKPAVDRGSSATSSEAKRERLEPPLDQRRPRRVRAIRLPQLSPDPPDGARDKHGVPVLDAEPLATDAGWQGLQGRRVLCSEHNHDPADSRRGIRAVLPAGLRRASCSAAQCVHGAAKVPRVRAFRRDVAGLSTSKTRETRPPTSTSRTCQRAKCRSS